MDTVFKFGPNDLHYESRHIFHWHVFVPDGVSFKELLKKESWANVAHQLRPMARIHVTSESNKFIGTLVVISCGPLWAQVEEIFYKDFKDVEVKTANGEYAVSWVSNRYKWGVRRLSDKEWIVKDCPTEGEANAAMANLLKEVRLTG